jgi:peptide/nickel transport system substrate-binding protein
MTPAIRSLVALVALVVAWVGPPVASVAAAPEGTLTIARTESTAARWFDPAEMDGGLTVFFYAYALHDALVKPMPGNPLAPCLAESWSTSPDGLTYEFALRKGVKFHNGDPLTAEDVKFSFERYRGAAAKTLKDRVASVDVVDPHHVRFRLKRPWPDFMTFYGTLATGAGWVVPRKYVERVGDDGFKRAPVGAGPYKFVSFKPGVELVLEANEQYWRKTPSVKTLVMRSVTDVATRLVMLKRGEADIAYAFAGSMVEEIKRTPGLTLRPFYPPFVVWLLFTEQWDPKSPWSDRRVRLAANLALDREALNQAETLGLSKLTASIIPRSFDGYWPVPLYPHDPQRAKQLLAEAGYPNGFDAGPISVDISWTTVTEALVNDLRAVGIRATVRPLERAAFVKEYQDKRLRPIVQSGSAAFGNAATRLDAYVGSTGPFTYGTYPDIEGLMRELAGEVDRGKRETILHRIQQLVHDKVMYAPLWEQAGIGAFGPRVAEPAIGLITNMATSAPYEELRLKGK